MFENPRQKPDSDDDIVSGLQAGDERALATLMERHLKTITAIGYYMLGDTHLAEDVAQTTFLKLWTMAPKWKPGAATLLTWMRRVATNDCLDRLKKKTEIFSDSLPEQIDETPSALKTLEEDEMARNVQTALLALPDTQRAAITLSYYQDVSQKEGAKILNVSEKAYESLLSRARKTLKATLSPLLMETVR